MPDYKVLHTALDSYREGEIITDAKIKEVGIDVDRLLSLGAVEKHREYKDEDDTPEVFKGSGTSMEQDNGSPSDPHTPADISPPAAPPAPASKYAKVPPAALKAQAVERGIEGADSMKQAALIAALDADDKAKADAASVPPGPAETPAP